MTDTTGTSPIEFFHDLTSDREVKALFHFMPRLDPTTEKPVPTPDAQPDQRPFQWSEVFPGIAGEPIEIEIGSGKGGFLVEYGKLHPEIRLLGTEWDTSIAIQAAERFPKHKLANTAIVRGDVYYFLRDRVPENSVRAVHMYFPDPWPKKRHHKNRLAIKPGFLEAVRKCLLPGGGHFHWGTDHAGYNQAAWELFEQIPWIETVIRDSAEPTEGIQTNFEKKYRLEGRPIYRSILRIRK